MSGTHSDLRACCTRVIYRPTIEGVSNPWGPCNSVGMAKTRELDRCTGIIPSINVGTCGAMLVFDYQSILGVIAERELARFAGRREGCLGVRLGVWDRYIISRGATVDVVRRAHIFIVVVGFCVGSCFYCACWHRPSPLVGGKSHAFSPVGDLVSTF